MQRSLSFPEDLKQLLSLIRGGKANALREWITSGKRLRFDEVSVRQAQIISEAVKVGFSNVLEELLRAGGWSEPELASALESALWNRRTDLAVLLQANGAKLKHLDFDTICRPMNFELMERYMQEGGDPTRNNAFATALAGMKARPLLRFYRSFREQYPALDYQAALALMQAVEQEQLRWAALLVWAGADPFRPVPSNLEEEFDPEYCTTAASKAVWRNKPELLKVLKLNPTPAQALDLLDDASYSGNISLFQTLVKAIPSAQLNNSPRGSSIALERLVSRHPSRDLWANTVNTENDEKHLQPIEFLLDHGARWNPDPNGLRFARRALLKHDGRYIVQVLRLLLYTPNAANLDAFNELCSSQTLRAKAAAADPPLGNELAELRKKCRKQAVAAGALTEIM